MNTKRIEDLTIRDIQEKPVWRFAARRGADEACLAPVNRIPCSDLKGKIVGTKVNLANGSQVWALLGNIDVSAPQLTQHFLTISIYGSRGWFHLARYHDYDYGDRGPKQLAAFLALQEHEVFPIRFDLRGLLTSTDTDVLVGSIEREPRTRLSRAQIVAMAVP